ncbi:levansucrase [Acetobacter oeni]|uniref:Levansucrase n=2 Tax=Acetobacter oeni TaxID=304077 RepID=A0A511XLQ0_9PROT|nr:levansucrase [Acetobacter oeni LMG 21952]GEN63858.1 levansucrase [Acetobacter oeni]
MDESVMIWDTGALRNIHGETVTFKGWHVIWSLAVDKIDLTNASIVEEWDTRNNRAYIGFWFSKTGNGADWQWGGRLLQTSADLRPHEWSGSLVMREDTANCVDMFYTSEADAPVNQSVPSVSTGHIFADETGVWFEGFSTSTEMFSADGIHEANSDEDEYFDFRDPHVFMNPEDGRVYAVYEGNVPGMRGDFTIGSKEQGLIPPGFEVGAGAEYGAAAIGIAVLDDGAYEAGDFSKSRWTQLEPLVTALGVNDQTERPHVVFRDGRVYLFTISHASTYSGGLVGPDGVYGFVSDDGLFGPYRPLNSSGLVLGNNQTQPLATYSHFVDPEGYVQSFINYIPDPTAADPSAYRIGATLAPTVRIALEGDRTFLSDVWNYGEIFAQGAWPVDPAPDKRPIVSESDSKIIE